MSCPAEKGADSQPKQEECAGTEVLVAAGLRADRASLSSYSGGQPDPLKQAHPVQAGFVLARSYSFQISSKSAAHVMLNAASGLFLRTTNVSQLQRHLLIVLIWKPRRRRDAGETQERCRREQQAGGNVESLMLGVESAGVMLL